MVLGQDHFVYLEGIVLVLSKRNVSALKFEHANSKGPDVNIESIASSLYYLRSHVVRSADDRESFLIFGENFGGSQIYHSEIAVGLDHEVLWLEVSVDDVL